MLSVGPVFSAYSDGCDSGRTEEFSVASAELVIGRYDFYFISNFIISWVIYIDLTHQYMCYNMYYMYNNVLYEQRANH